jgi:hypothetical protein
MKEIGLIFPVQETLGADHFAIIAGIVNESYQISKYALFWSFSNIFLSLSFILCDPLWCLLVITQICEKSTECASGGEEYHALL